MKRKCEILRWLMLFIFANPFVQSGAHAQEQSIKPLTQYIHRAWTNKEGLPHNSARALVQTQDGYLWIATQDGLARFNGEGFHVFDKNNTPALKHNDITALIETTDGTLWIGTYNGLVSLKNGVFTYHPTNDGKELEIIRALATDHEGNLLIGTMNAGLKKYKDGKIESVTTAQGLSSNTVYAIAEDRQGNIWIGTETGVNVYRRGQCSSFSREHALPEKPVRSIYVGSDSTVWIGTNGGLVRWKKGSMYTYTTTDGLSYNAIRAIYEDRSGVMWIGTERGGICQFANGVFTPYSISDGLLGDMVVAILEDREGILWVGIYNNGLDQFWKGKFLNYTMREGLPSNGASSIIQARDGNVWIGSAGLVRFDGKKFTTFTTKNGLPHNNIRSLFEDSRGDLWIGTEGGLVQSHNGTFRIYKAEEGLANNYIRSIREDRQGHLWVGTSTGGIHRMENGRFVNYRDKGLPMNVIRSIFVDHSGTVWIGSNDAVRSWRNDTIITYTQKDGLPFEPIYEMIEDNAHTLWMGSYGGGLVRYKDGIFTRYTFKQGLYNDAVYSLVEDNRGYLWLGGMKGISCLSKQMLNDFAEGKIDHIRYTAYTSADGMVTSDCAGNMQSGACKTSDGRLWFSTNGGIVVVDPSNLQDNPLPPPVMVERIVVNGVDCSPYEYTQVPVGKGQVEFHYSGLSYQVPEKVQFQYILEGFETEWKTVGIRRAAFYTNLAPGKYVFRVKACNNDGVWNETGASYAFELKPYFYQTWWFYGLVILAFGGAGFGAYRLRVRQLLKHKEELTKSVDEALAKIKVLNGLIPICAHCKKIRDDKGYWNQLEEYIDKHSEATFTHGVCPECSEKLYGGYYAKIKKQQAGTSSQSLPTNLPKEENPSSDNSNTSSNESPPR